MHGCYTEPVPPGNPHDEPTGDDERVLNAEAPPLFAAVYKLCGIVHDHERWAVEAAHRGSDWAAVLNLQADIVAGIRKAA
jgi:hypothetical protein